MADTNTQIENQYKNLWDNMQQTNSHNFALIGGIIAASAGILAAGFANIKEIENIKEGAKLDAAVIGCLFMCVYVITIPGQFLLNGNRRHIWRQSTYMRVFLEPWLEFSKYETNMAKRYTQEKNKKLLSSGVIENEWLIIFIINSIATIAALVCFHYSRFLLAASTVVLIVVVAGLWWIGFSFLFWVKMNNLKRGKKIERNHYDAWMRIKLQPSMGIFQISNLVDKKYFIGSSMNLAVEWHSQKWQLDNDQHVNGDLQKDWKKYGGANNFRYEILEEISIKRAYNAIDYKGEDSSLDDNERLKTHEQYFESLQSSLKNQLYSKEAVK